MYVNGTIDHDGPPCHPPSKAATRIKRGVVRNVKATEGNTVAIKSQTDYPQQCIIFANAMEDDPVIISSNTDSPPVFCTAKGKAVPKKKKAKYILISDSSEGEMAVDVNEKVVDVGLLGEADAYEEPGPSLKHKAKELQTAHPIKRHARTAESKPEKIAPKKGKQRALDNAHKNAEDSSAKSDFPDMLTIRGMYWYSMTTSFTYDRNSSNMRTS